MQPKELPSLLEYYVQTIKLYGILAQVLDGQETRPVSSPEALTDTSARAILSLDSKIMEWRDSLPAYLKCDSSSIEANFVEEPCAWGRTTGLSRGAGSPSTVKEIALQVFFSLPQGKLLLIQCQRFLHTRQLILRPALELLFEKQQQKGSDTTTSKASLEAKLQDSMLHNIASQCALSAVDLVDFLASQIQTQTFLCWWYNISCK